MKRILFIVLLVLWQHALYFFIFKERGCTGRAKTTANCGKIPFNMAFDKNVDSLLDAYVAIRDAFVDGDSVKAKRRQMLLLRY